MGIRISDLPQATQINNNDIIPIVQEGETKQVNANQILNIPDITQHTLVVSPTEPVTDRKKVWLQSNVKNMLNKRIINANVKSDGTFVEENTRLIFDYIEVKPNLTLTFSLNITSGFLGIAFYDENKTFISRAYDNMKTSITATVPSTAKYVRPFIQINGDTVLDENSINAYEMQLENGELRTTYEAVVEDKTFILNDNDIYEEYVPKSEEIYSTTEQRIGTYLGKPLYRKVLKFGALANNGETTVDYDSTYIIQQFNVYVKNPTSGVKFHLPVVGTNYINAFDYIPNNRIAILTTSDRTGFTNNYVIIEYTKTTD